MLSHASSLSFHTPLLPHAGTVAFRFPGIDMALYDSPYEAQLYCLFDANKRVVAHGDFAPCRTAKEVLEPGEYEVSLHAAVRDRSPPGRKSAAVILQLVAFI